MKQFLVALALLYTATASLADRTPAGEVDTDTGRIIVNGQKLKVSAQYDSKPLELHSEHIVANKGKNPGLFLSVYWDGPPSSMTLTQHIIIIDATGSEIRRSNVLDTGLDFVWSDNNYVRFESGAMYFGIYSPKRVQFVYRNGKLAENKGPWRGTQKPNVFVSLDPCFNVNGLEEYRKEVAEE